MLVQLNSMNKIPEIGFKNLLLDYWEQDVCTVKGQDEMQLKHRKQQP
jgi:hypothetical protein